MTTSLSKELNQIINRALIDDVATSISLFVGFGQGDLGKDIEIVAEKEPKDGPTIYDLASVTKICGTTIAVAKAVLDDKMSLDEKPFLAWPITIRSILAHTAGLPAHKKFYEDLSLSNKDFAFNRELIFEELFKVIPSTKRSRVYSDLGFIALGFLLEERLKRPLDEILSHAALIAKAPLFTTKSASPFYQPEKNFAPTGYCPVRLNQVLGQVHDANCFFMGGTGGHAGFFGTLAEMKAMGRFFLSAVKNPDSPLKDLLARFAKDGLGFDRREVAGPAGPLSPGAFGHYGFCGTSLWIDPSHGKDGMIVSLLTNRVHKNKTLHQIFRLRRAINKAIKKAHEQTFFAHP